MPHLIEKVPGTFSIIGNVGCASDGTALGGGAPFGNCQLLVRGRNARARTLLFCRSSAKPDRLPHAFLSTVCNFCKAFIKS